MFKIPSMSIPLKFVFFNNANDRVCCSRKLLGISMVAYRKSRVMVQLTYICKHYEDIVESKSLS